PEFDIVQHPIRDTVWIVSALLSLMAHKNDGQYNPLVDPITPFHSRAVPRISIEAYLTRILQFIPFTNEVLLNVLVFLDRIGGLAAPNGFRVNSFNIHRLLITCLMVAA
ncbi:MAG: cyclin-domain-containing protein, partial [Linnemannia gamsii]